MKKIYLFSLLLLIFSACSDLNEAIIDDPTNSQITPKSAGDGVYDVLGYGYDVTAEYLHPKAVKFQVLDIEKYKKDYPTRLDVGTSSWGYDYMYYGYSSEDYLGNMQKELDVKTGGNYLAFSGTFNASGSFKSNYEYSSKYSFASVDAIRNKKYIRINDEIDRLSKYLSSHFIEDLTKLSADRLVEKYGTHILTDFTIGGRYKILYRSVIEHSKDETTKKITVASGAKFTIKAVGINVDNEGSIETSETYVKDNTQKELFIMFYGGNGTNLKYDLEKGMPTSVDLAAWENAVKLDNSTLTDINWKETYMIYDFIDDPVKKVAIKTAVENHIKNNQLNMLEVLPVYSSIRLGKISGQKEYLTRVTSSAEDLPSASGQPMYTYLYEKLDGYVLRDPLSGTVPLYNSFYWNSSKRTRENFFFSTQIIKSFPGGRDVPEGWYTITRNPVGYVYPNLHEMTKPLYEYRNSKSNCINSTRIDFTQVEPKEGWRIARTTGYIFPASLN